MEEHASQYAGIVLLLIVNTDEGACWVEISLTPYIMKLVPHMIFIKR